MTSLLLLLRVGIDEECRFVGALLWYIIIIMRSVVFCCSLWQFVGAYHLNSDHVLRRSDLGLILFGGKRKTRNLFLKYTSKRRTIKTGTPLRPPLFQRSTDREHFANSLMTTGSWTSQGTGLWREEGSAIRPIYHLSLCSCHLTTFCWCHHDITNRRPALLSSFNKPSSCFVVSNNKMSPSQRTSSELISISLKEQQTHIIIVKS